MLRRSMPPRPFSNCGTLAKRNCFRSARLVAKRKVLQGCFAAQFTLCLQRNDLSPNRPALLRAAHEAGDASDRGGRCIHGQRAWGRELYNKRVGAGVGVLQLHVSSQQSPRSTSMISSKHAVLHAASAASFSKHRHIGSPQKRLMPPAPAGSAEGRAYHR